MSGSKLFKISGEVNTAIALAATLVVYGSGIYYGMKACYAWGYERAEMRYEAKHLEEKFKTRHN